MTRSDRKYLLEEEIEEWHARLKKAFLSVVNSKRKAQNMEPYPPSILIFIPKGPNANLRLLTLKVWCMRHHITPEWLIEKLMYRFRGIRKQVDYPDRIVLGLNASILIGTASQNTIKEVMEREFPDRENLKSQRTPIPQEIHVKDLDLSIPMAVDKYADAIAKERIRLEKATKIKRKRNYRQI